MRTWLPNNLVPCMFDPVQYWNQAYKWQNSGCQATTSQQKNINKNIPLYDFSIYLVPYAHLVPSFRPNREAYTRTNNWEKDGGANVEPNVRKQMIVSDEMMAVHWERWGQRWPSMLRTPLAPHVSQTDLSCPSCMGPTHPHCFQWVSQDTIHHNTSLSVRFICRMDDFLYYISERVRFQGFAGGMWFLCTLWGLRRCVMKWWVGDVMNIMLLGVVSRIKYELFSWVILKILCLSNEQFNAKFNVNIGRQIILST